jgi:hypothetical protein
MLSHRISLCVALLVVSNCAALAQALVPATPLDPRFGGGFASGGSADARNHKGPTGKPCITVSGDSRSQTVNPQIYNHVVVAANSCSQNISMKVCYYHSDHCIAMTVPGYSQKEAMLGIMPSMNGFRFEFRERFNGPGAF